MRFKDLTGLRFGRLLVTGVSHKDKNIYHWMCQCDCGSIKAITRNALQQGSTQSCGCLQREITIERNTKHGMSKTQVYGVWSEMINRASNPAHQHFEYYLGRGIGVSEDWKSFEQFYKDMGERPEGAWIERLDNNLGYSKDNCRWGTVSEQGSNQRSLNNTSGRIGVYRDKDADKWRALIYVNHHRIDCGRFEDFKQACDAIENAELEHLGYSRGVRAL